MSTPSADLSRLSIITVTCNSATCLEGFLSCLDSGIRDRVIVVDNGSLDGTLTIARREGLHTLPMGSNLGFARAANAGARAATGDHLCFINPDCRPPQGFFHKAVATLQDNPEACLVPAFQEAGGAMVQGMQPGYTWLKLLADVLATDYRLTSTADWLSRRSGFHDHAWSWPHGACFFISRRRFLELGHFDEDYFLYMEDVDFGRRFTVQGGCIRMLPVNVLHISGQSCRALFSLRREWLDRSRIRYAFKHHGKLFGGVLWFLTLPPRGYRKFFAARG